MRVGAPSEPAGPAPASRRAPSRPLVRLAALALLGAWLGARTQELAPGAAAPAALGITSLAPVAWFAARRAVPASALAAALVFALAGLRAAGAEPRPVPTGVGEGRYWPSGAFGGTERGRLVGDGRSLELPAGSVRPGELLRIDPATAPSAPARGPIVRGAGGQPRWTLAPDELRRLSPASSDALTRLRVRLVELRARATARLEARFADPRLAGLVAAILLGERGGLDPELADRFTRTGTRHLLAISGLHVALVAGSLATPLALLLAAGARRVRRAPRIATHPGPWIALLLAPLVPLSGAGAPVTRAFVALALYALTRSLPPTPEGGVRRADPLSLLALAVALELAADPRAADSLSLRLSYAATLGLVVCVGPLLRGIRARLPGVGRLPRTTRLGREVPAWLRVPLQRSVDGGCAALAVSLAASLATLPIVWANFGELGLAGVIATPLCVPFLLGLLALGWIALLVPVAALDAALDALAAGLVGLLELADHLPGTPLVLPPRPAAWLALATAGALAVASGRAPRAVARTAALAMGLLLVPWKPAPTGLELHVLDVGNGTAAVLRAPGLPALVFDAGSRDRRGVGRAALAPLLASFEVRGAAYVLSHVDRDHSAALPWILERFPPRLWLGARTREIEARLPRGVPRLDPDVGRTELRLGAGDGGPLRLELLRGRAGEDNQGSRSLLVRWGAERLLLSGDADDTGLAHKLRAGWLDGPLRLLLIPHHGSESRFLFPLLERAAPREVWISASGDPPVVPELVRRGLAWRSTGRDGPLELRLPGPGATPRQVELDRNRGGRGH